MVKGAVVVAVAQRCAAEATNRWHLVRGLHLAQFAPKHQNATSSSRSFSQNCDPNKAEPKRLQHRPKWTKLLIKKSAVWSFLRHLLERLIEIVDDINDVLNPNGHTDHIWRNTGRNLLLFAQLFMRRRSRVDDKCLGITDVRQMGCELDRFDELLSALDTALDSKRQHGTEAVLPVILLRHLVVRVLRQSSVADPADFRVLPPDFIEDECPKRVQKSDQKATTNESKWTRHSLV